MRLDDPVILSRDQAAQLARLELTDPAYRRAEPTALQRIIDWVLEKVNNLLDTVGSSAPGGWPGVLLLTALLIGAIVIALYRLGPLRPTVRSAALFDADVIRTAADHRRAAEDLAAGSDYAGAVVERLRALIRELEEREVVLEQPGRTAAEAAAEAARALPTSGPVVRAAAVRFDEIWYGNRVADRQSYDLVVSADDAVRIATPAETGPPT